MTGVRVQFVTKSGYVTRKSKPMKWTEVPAAPPNVARIIYYFTMELDCA